MLTPRRLAVWGDPIAHSRSPRLHAAAYEVLGLDWAYDRRRVTEAEFGAAVAGLGPEWLGLSLTMPLKLAAFRHAARHDRRATLTEAANTLLLGRSGASAFNTDVGGIVGALAEDGIAQVAAARIVGAGATAISALVALQELGATRVDVVARRPEAASRLAALGDAIGVRVTASALGAPAAFDVPVTIATLPGDAVLPSGAAEALATAGGSLLDVVYGTWPTTLAAAWAAAGRPAASGLGMLLHQALRQVRVFVGGDPESPVDREDAVLAAMRRAVMGD
jgi:shikimate dehydrogenase